MAGYEILFRQEVKGSNLVWADLFKVPIALSTKLLVIDIVSDFDGRVNYRFTHIQL